MNQNILKGIFIVLVVVDHNNFARSVFPRFLEGFSFHVLGFMVVPFLRPAFSLNRSLAHYLFRLYYPFFVLTTILSIVVALTTPIGSIEQAYRWLHAVYSGNADLLKDTTHMALLWFLPSFLCLIALRSAIENTRDNICRTIIAALWLVHPFIGTFGRSVDDFLPLGLVPALYIIPLAYLSIWVHRVVFTSMGRGSAIVLSCVMYILIKASQIHFGFRNEIGFSAVADYRTPLALLVNDAEAISGVLMVVQLSRLSFFRLLEVCGKYSLQLYLFHAFVAVLVYRLIYRLTPSVDALALFTLSLVTTVLITVILARFAAEQPFVQRFLFPRSLHELRGRSTHPSGASYSSSRDSTKGEPRQ